MDSRAELAGGAAERRASVAYLATSIVSAGVWIGVAAAAPELIWQGSVIAAHHVGRTELLSALLVGVVLAFFVEPGMERARRVIHGRPHGEPEDAGAANPLFVISLSLAFALVSVCLHEVITAFVGGHEENGAVGGSGLTAAIELTLSWAVVPFFVTVAWLGARWRWAALPLGLAAAAAPVVTGYLFAWDARDTVTTAVPCVAILLLGYRRMRRAPRHDGFAPCARGVALVAVVWLAGTRLVDTVLDLSGRGEYRLYAPWEFWLDVRFYLGWAVGLVLAPFPWSPPVSPPAALPHEAVPAER